MVCKIQNIIETKSLVYVTPEEERKNSLEFFMLCINDDIVIFVLISQSYSVSFDIHTKPKEKTTTTDNSHRSRLHLITIN